MTVTVAAQDVDFEPFRRAVEIKCAAVVAKRHGHDIRFVIEAQGQAHDLAGADDVLHFARIVVGDAHDLGVGRGVRIGEEVIHVAEVKVDTGDAPDFTGGHGRKEWVVF